MVTGIATAMIDSSPIVCITGQVGSQLIGTDAFQEIDITGITLPVTKHNYLVTRARGRRARRSARRSTIAQVGPARTGAHRHHERRAAVAPASSTGTRPRPSGARAARHRRPCRPISHAPLELIQAAKRPVILAGHGVTISGAENALRAFAERGNIPVAVTLLGIGGLPASHPLNLGMMGMHGEAWVNIAIQEADLLIACGMRFDDRVTGKLETYAPQRARRSTSRSTRPRSTRTSGSTSRSSATCARCSIASCRWSNRAIAVRGWPRSRRRAATPRSATSSRCPTTGTSTRRTSSTISGARPATHDTIVVTDVGQHQMWEAQYYHHERPRSLITSGGLGTMGFAVPAAIGAKRARPEAEVWAVVGDGGFQMTMCELATAVQEGIAIKVAIINNGYLGMVRQWQEFFYERRYAATPLSGPDFVKLADAFGIRGRAVPTRARRGAGRSRTRARTRGRS